MKLEIKNLEYEVVAVENELADIDQRIRRYNHEFALRLGLLVEEILQLRRDYAQQHQAKSAFTQQQYEQARQQYEDFRHERLIEEQTTFNSLEEEELARLKKLYRQCVVRCHPDKVAEAQQAEATELFRQVQQKYEEQDLAALARLAEQLERNDFWAADNALSQLDQLLTRREKLADQLAELKQALADTMASTVYREIIGIADLEQHWQTLRQQLEQELASWKTLTHESATI
ncbi:J domain-containing protein [Hymenobacter weizhouensis]|uniref:J domain-containing protein n=1 Tax=Hymenobacter sp. YIM 151500-1 TaxID=2987689 RepID=UPI002225F0B1|nr:J domain-containing protein [Hymenobacter sp. YIM 151500-1]UYZ64197.1 J domain-containing protein [Hymenobacter sp. YIM 151500-1]